MRYYHIIFLYYKNKKHLRAKIFIKRGQARLYLLFLFIALSIFCCKAQNKVVFGLDDKELSLTDNLCIFIDSNSSYSCKQIIEKYQNASFNYRMSDLPKHSNNTYWLALNIDNKKNEELYLLVQPGFISYLNFYKTKNHLIIDSILSGKKQNEMQSPLNGMNHFIFSLDSGQFIYFLKIKSDVYLPLPLRF